MEPESGKEGLNYVSIDIMEKIASIIEQVLNVQVPLDLPLVEAGMDSITSVDLRDHLNDKFSINLDPTVVYDYPTGRALAGHIQHIQDLGRLERQEVVDEEVLAAIDSSVPDDMEYPIINYSQEYNTRTVHLNSMSSKLPGIAGSQIFAGPTNELCKPIPKQVRTPNTFFYKSSTSSSFFYSLFSYIAEVGY
jgi:acyl carrier protein